MWIPLVGLGVAAAVWLFAAAGREGGDGSRGLAPAGVAELRVAAGAREGVAPLVATTPDQARSAGLRAAEGRLLAELDLRDARRVAVLGADLRAELFGFRAALLRPIRIGDARFTVVGVLEPAPPHGRARLGAPDPDRAVFVPASAAAAHLPRALAASP
jgi:putative ABC transport system permease protein